MPLSSLKKPPTRQRGATDERAFQLQHCFDATTKENNMKYARAITIATMAAMTSITILSAGCAVVRGQETTGAYIDDAGITTAVKAKFVEDKTVSALAINVKTLNGTVQLSGFAKSSAEKEQAGALARNVKNVRSVDNAIIVRP